MPNAAEISLSPRSSTKRICTAFCSLSDNASTHCRNADVRRVTYDEIRQLFPGCAIRLKRLTLAAPLARLVAPHSTMLYRALDSIPFLRTHYLGVIRPAATS